MNILFFFNLIKEENGKEGGDNGGRCFITWNLKLIASTPMCSSSYYHTQNRIRI